MSGTEMMAQMKMMGMGNGGGMGMGMRPAPLEVDSAVAGAVAALEERLSSRFEALLDARFGAIEKRLNNIAKDVADLKEESQAVRPESRTIAIDTP
jgi:hypothetical protein